MKRVKYSTITAAVLLMTLSGFSPMLETRAAAPPAAPGPRAVMEKVITDALAVLRDSKLTAAQRHDKIRQIAYSSMDFLTMSEFSLGQNCAILRPSNAPILSRRSNSTWPTPMAIPPMNTPTKISRLPATTRSPMAIGPW